MLDLISRHLGYDFRRILVIQFCLCLPLKPGIGMLDRNHRRHTIAHIGPCEVHILFFQDIQLSCIIVDDSRKHCLEAGQMGAALCVVDIVAKAQYIFVELIDILERRFYGNPFALSLIINDLMNRLFGFIHVSEKTCEPVRFMKLQYFRYFFSSVLKPDRKLWI